MQKPIQTFILDALGFKKVMNKYPRGCPLSTLSLFWSNPNVIANIGCSKLLSGMVKNFDVLKGIIILDTARYVMNRYVFLVLHKAIFSDFQLWPLAILHPLEIKRCPISHLNTLQIWNGRVFSQEPNSNFKVWNLGSKYPYLHGVYLVTMLFFSDRSWINTLCVLKIRRSYSRVSKKRVGGEKLKFFLVFWNLNLFKRDLIYFLAMK